MHLPTWNVSGCVQTPPSNLTSPPLYTTLALFELLDFLDVKRGYSIILKLFCFEIEPYFITQTGLKLVEILTQTLQLLGLQV